MPKSVRVLFIAFVLFIFGVIGYKLGNRKEYNFSGEPSPTPEAISSSNVSLGENTYAFDYIRVKDASRIKLLPNFSEQKTSQEIIDGGKCKNLINAGFYSKNFTPIGLFISEGDVISRKQTNATLNGLFLISEANIPDILREIGDKKYRIGLQAGPILIFDSTPLKLSLKDEEQEADRRVVVALNDKGEIYFLVVYKQESVFRGPQLSSLPEVLAEIQNSLGEKFVSALNLDGGTASTFWGERVTLKELSPIGSYFCIY